MSSVDVAVVKTSSGSMAGKAGIDPVSVEDLVHAVKTGDLDVGAQEISEDGLLSEDQSPEFVVKAVGPAAHTEERAEQPSPSGIISTPPTNNLRGRPRAKSLPTVSPLSLSLSPVPHPPHKFP